MRCPVCGSELELSLGVAGEGGQGVRRVAGLREGSDAYVAIGSGVVFLGVGGVFSLTSGQVYYVAAGLAFGAVATATTWYVLLWRRLAERRADRDRARQAQGDGAPVGRRRTRVGALPARPPAPDPASRADLWQDLDAEERERDLVDFARVLWNRQRYGLACGQRALRGQGLPSGFVLNDTLHAYLLEVLEQRLGVVRRLGGRDWEITAPASAVAHYAAEMDLWE